MTRPLVHFEIQTTDLARAREFYSQLFGWQIDANNPMNYGLIPPGIGGPEAGVGGGIAPSTESRVVLYIQVVDLQETLARAESLGGRRVMEPMDVPGGPTIAQLADPEGNVVGLVKQ